jgi:hypothetical protein
VSFRHAVEILRDDSSFTVPEHPAPTALAVIAKIIA